MWSSTRKARLSQCYTHFLKEGRNEHQKFCHVGQSFCQYFLIKSHSHQDSMLEISNIKTKIVMKTYLKYICVISMNMGNEWASEHPLINSSEQNLVFPQVQGTMQKVRNGLFWWFSQMDTDSRQNSILKSPVIYHKIERPCRQCACTACDFQVLYGCACGSVH